MKKIFSILTLSILFSLNLNSQSLQWAKGVGDGPNGDVVGLSITTDAGGNVYTTGYFAGVPDFEPNVGYFPLTSFGATDIFISKLDASGNFVWAKQMGAVGNEQANSITIDGSGNVYTTGQFQGTADFDPGAGTYTLNGGGLFISKLDASGNFVWAKQIANPGNGQGLSITVDGLGNIYTTGNFSGTGDFDPGVGTFTMTSIGSNDVFVSKLDASGNFVWAKQIGGTNVETGNSISFDGLGNVYTAGSFQGTPDFDPGVGTFTVTSAGNYDIFISKLDALGNFVWAKVIGGTGDDQSFSMTTDASNNVYTTGHFNGTVDFDPGVGTFTLTTLQNVFVSKLDASGNFVLAKQMGGSFAYGIDLDVSGNVYTTGFFSGTADFDPGVGTTTLTSSGSQDVFISKLDPLGNYIWAGAMGGSGQDRGASITADASNSLYTTGRFVQTADLDPGVGVYTLSTGGTSNNAFVHKMFQSTVGLNENEYAQLKIVSPNPSSDKFYFTGIVKESELEVYDLTGNLILKTEFKNENVIIDLSNYSNGMYFYKITGDKTFTGKLIKEK